MNGEDTEENLNKSEISQVFEIALKRNMPVNFEVGFGPALAQLTVQLYSGTNFVFSPEDIPF